MFQDNMRKTWEVDKQKPKILERKGGGRAFWSWGTRQTWGHSGEGTPSALGTLAALKERVATP